MRFIHRTWTPKSCMMATIRQAALGKGVFRLRTAADVYNFYNLHTAIQREGFNVFCRVNGNTVTAYVNQPNHSTASARRRYPKFREALFSLEPGTTQCLELNTPLEAHYFVTQRSNFLLAGRRFLSSRFGDTVLVWALQP